LESTAPIIYLHLNRESQETIVKYSQTIATQSTQEDSITDEVGITMTTLLLRGTEWIFTPNRKTRGVLQLEIKKGTNLILEFYGEEIDYGHSNNDFFTS